MNRPGPGDEQDDVSSALASRRDAAAAASGSSSTPVLEDAVLVSLVNDGDGSALEALYERYGRPCYSLARRILNDPTLAQDVVQEVFLALWRDASRYDANRGAFSTWLLSATHHKAVDAVRREENLRKRRIAADAQEATLAPPEGPADAAWSTLRRERVRSALATLPEVQRKAIGLAYYGGYTQREIAGLTDTPLGTVKTRMLAGMRKLRDSLQVPLDEVDPS
jgi:RNA polymerase sigma-70 factor (ECF subfamily)